MSNPIDLPNPAQTPSYRSQLWPVLCFAIPSLERYGALPGAALRALLAICYLTKTSLHGRWPGNERLSLPSVSVKASWETLIGYTGLPRRTVGWALKSLESHSLLQRTSSRKSGQRFGATRFALLNKQGQPYTSTKRSNVFFGHEPYAWFPSALLTERDQHWHLARITTNALRLYLVVLCLAAREHSLSVDADYVHQLAHLPRTSYQRALEELTSLELLYVSPADTERSSDSYVLCDPQTGLPIGDDATPAYTASGKRLTTNLTSADLERKLLEYFPSAQRGAGDQWNVQCPAHDDHVASCSVRLSHTSEGGPCFRCHACGAKGTFSSLLVLASERGTIPASAEPIVQGRLERKHQYHGADGKLLYEKLIYRRPDGTKSARFRHLRDPKHPKLGFIWQRGHDPVLYDLPAVVKASTVFLSESEKDADALAKLVDQHVACTSTGGAQSWDPSFSSVLQGKHVIVLPHNDDAGAKYAHDVMESLRSSSIPCVISPVPQSAKDIAEHLENMDDLGARQYILNILDSLQLAQNAQEPQRAPEPTPAQRSPEPTPAQRAPAARPPMFSLAAREQLLRRTDPSADPETLKGWLSLAKSFYTGLLAKNQDVIAQHPERWATIQHYLDTEATSVRVEDLLASLSTP